MLPRFEVDMPAVLGTTGIVLLVMAGAQVVPVLVAATTHEAMLPLALGALLVGVSGAALARLRPRARVFRGREALAIVLLAWLASTIAGAIPYVASGAAGPLDALFESLSGLTTTGASIFVDVDGLRSDLSQPAPASPPLALHVWRELTHWIGGAGIVLVVFVLTPFLTDKESLRRTQSAEASFMTVRYRGNTRATLRGLLTVYVGLTLLQTLALLWCGVGLLDAMLHSFATVATGGFSTHGASMKTWGAAVQMVTVVFMVFGALNFAVLGRAFEELRQMRRRTRETHGDAVAWMSVIVMAAPVFARAIWRDVECRAYVGLVLGASAVMVWVLQAWATAPYGQGGLNRAVQDGLFNVATISTTTGFGTEDFTLWPVVAQALLVALMLVGGCRGSTAGGIKVRRVLILFLAVRREVLRAAHPRGVFPLRLGGELIDEDQVREALVFSVTYVGLLILIAVALTGTGADLVTAGSATASCFASTGPGLGQAGPISNYQVFTPTGKLLLMAAMALGRLELYPILTALRPSFWLRRVRPRGQMANV
ncbi:MAG: TrkH family potassium uptake protein [Planctomycetota bacterium]